MRSKVFRSQPTFGDVASGASHDIGARNAIKSFFNYIWCQTANKMASRARKISLKFVEKISILNRIYRANIVTSGPRSTSKACFVKKLSIAFLAPTSWFAALAPHSQRGLHVWMAYPAPISWQKRPCSQSDVKHVSVSTAMAFKASDRRHHAVEIIRNPVSSYFHSQVSIFMRLSSLALPWIAIFARKCDCHAMVNSLAIARIAISTRNLQLSSLRLYGVLAHRPCPKLEMFCPSVLQLFYGCSKILMSNHGMSFIFAFCFFNRLEIRAQLP